jgi:pseudaminic acid biosynthesis-associated methylase
MKFKTEQETFWAGKFGSDYINRNQGKSLLASNINFFCKALSSVSRINNCIEFGTNIGMNLKALKILYPDQNQFGIEINNDAVIELKKNIPSENVFHSSILDFENSGKKWDLVLIKGVLIHINPNELTRVYEKLFAACGKYLLVAEYYNPIPVALPYRGNTDKLFKRDFAGEIMERYPSMELIDYGFIYRRDVKFPQDDVNWFLMKKAQN